MKKIIAVLLTVCLCAAAFAACGKENASYNINDVSAAVEKAVTIETPIAFSEDDLKLDMSMDMANVEEYTGHRTGKNGAAGAVLVIKAKAGAADTVKAQLETYKQGQAAFLANYPEFAAAQKQAEQGRIVVKGDYLVLAIAGEGIDYTAVDKAIDEALK